MAQIPDSGPGSNPRPVVDELHRNCNPSTLPRRLAPYPPFLPYFLLGTYHLDTECNSFILFTSRVTHGDTTAWSMPGIRQVLSKYLMLKEGTLA